MLFAVRCLMSFAVPVVVRCLLCVAFVRCSSLVAGCCLSCVVVVRRCRCSLFGVCCVLTFCWCCSLFVVRCSLFVVVSCAL